MSVTIYWKERLVAEHPFWSDGHRAERLHLRSLAGDAGAWPYAVARSTMYEDYKCWHYFQYCVPYTEHCDDIPSPVDEMGFFAATAPWLYVIGRKQQVRTYSVGECNRYFIRLSEWEVHVAAFELNSGLRIAVPSVYFDAAKVGLVTLARAEYLAEVAERRSLMSPAMREHFHEKT